MKSYHVANSIIPRLVGARAITLYPFIFYAGKVDIITLRHEMVHVEQVRRDGWLFFYVNYLYQYVKNRFSGMDHKTAYLNIPYEQEAFEREKL